MAKWVFDKVRGGRAYGPYTRKDGRKHVIVYKPRDDGTYNRDCTKETVSYPKWLMEQKLCRILDPNKETVDHKDRDFTNDKISNLKILSRPIHAALDALRRKHVDAICVWCSKQFEFKALRRGKINKYKAGPFCSKTCSGQYGAALQNLTVKKLPPMKKITRVYYLNNK